MMHGEDDSDADTDKQIIGGGECGGTGVVATGGNNFSEHDARAEARWAHKLEQGRIAEKQSGGRKSTSGGHNKTEQDREQGRGRLEGKVTQGRREKSKATYGVLPGIAAAPEVATGGEQHPSPDERMRMEREWEMEDAKAVTCGLGGREDLKEEAEEPEIICMETSPATTQVPPRQISTGDPFVSPGAYAVPAVPGAPVGTHHGYNNELTIPHQVPTQFDTDLPIAAVVAPADDDKPFDTENDKFSLRDRRAQVCVGIVVAAVAVLGAIVGVFLGSSNKGNGPTALPKGSPISPLNSQAPSPSPSSSMPTSPPTASNKIFLTRMNGCNRDTGYDSYMFDITAKKDLIIQNMELHVNSDEKIAIEIWTKKGQYINFETDQSAWDKVAEIEVIGKGKHSLTPLPADAFDPISVPSRTTQAFYVTTRDAEKGIFFCNIESCTDNHETCEYWATNGECSANPGYMLNDCKRSCGACLGYHNSDLQLNVGAGVGYPFLSHGDPSVFNGLLEYTLLGSECESNDVSTIGGELQLKSIKQCADVSKLLNAFVDSCNGGDSQKWFWDASTEEIRNVHNRKCLDYSKDSTDEKNLITHDCHGGQNQMWRWDGSRLISRHDGRCIDMEQDSQNLFMNYCHDGESEKFTVEERFFDTCQDEIVCDFC